MPLLGLCAGLAGCATPTTSIVSQPPGALIAVDGVNVGTAPVQYKFDFRHTPTPVVVASKEGYISEQIALNSDSSAIKGSQLPIFLTEDPAYQATTTCEADNNWLRVQVEPSLAPDVVWQKLVDSVTGRYPSLEMIDNVSGYMRSVYVTQKFQEKREELWVRTRFICSISSKTPLVYKMKIESNRPRRWPRSATIGSLTTAFSKRTTSWSRRFKGGWVSNSLVSIFTIATAAGYLVVRCE